MLSPNQEIKFALLSGEIWVILLKNKEIGEFRVNSLDVKGNVIGELLTSPSDTSSGIGALDPLESALDDFSFAVADAEEQALAKAGLAIRKDEKHLALGVDFIGLVVIFSESRFSFRLLVK